MDGRMCKKGIGVLITVAMVLFTAQAVSQTYSSPAPQSQKLPAGVAKAAKPVSLTPADVHMANRLVTDKPSRAPYLVITVQGKTMPGYDTINLYQNRAEPEDLYVLLLLKTHWVTGKMPPPPVVEEGARQVLLKTSGQTSNWKMAGIRTFWGGYATTRFTAAELKSSEHVPGWFVYYLMDKSTARQKAANAKLGAAVGATEAWNRAMQGWQQHQAGIAQRSEFAQTMRGAYLTEWDAQWAVQQSIEAVERGQ